MREKIKTLISYIHPVMIEVRSGEITPYLEVIRDRGKNVLNTHNSNYSYGSLHHIMSQFFKQIKLENYSCNNILILGMGAGSIISLLRLNYNINCPITTVEKDAVIIELAKRHFNIGFYNNLTIVHEDAFDFVTHSNEKFDLIISDLFIDNDVPKKFASNEYLMNLKRLSPDSRLVVYNKMTEEKKHKQELTELLYNFENIFPGCELSKFYSCGSENSILYTNSLAGINPLEKQNYAKFQPIQLTPSFS